MKNPLLLIAGPCVIENDVTPFLVAERVSAICKRLGIDYVFKSSYKKANRTSLSSFTGIDFDKALQILSDVKKQFNVPVLTDIHESHEVNE